MLLNKLRSTIHDLAILGRETRLTGEAAKVAFYFFLSLFPFILVLFSLTGFLGGEPAFTWLMSRLQEVVPGQGADFLERFVREVTTSRRPGVLSLSALLTVWSASKVFGVFEEGLNDLYGVTGYRPWWRRRLLSIFMVGLCALSWVVGATAMLAGPELIKVSGLSAYWGYLRWPLGLGLVMGMMWMIYSLFPNYRLRRSKRHMLVGACVGTTLWFVATVLFRVYVTRFARLGGSYGFVGGMVVLLFWLQLTALTILWGGGVAAVLERRSRVRKAQSESAEPAEAAD